MFFELLYIIQNDSVNIICSIGNIFSNQTEFCYFTVVFSASGFKNMLNVKIKKKGSRDILLVRKSLL